MTDGEAAFLIREWLGRVNDAGWWGNAPLKAAFEHAIRRLEATTPIATKQLVAALVAIGETLRARTP